jgi:hypothetical protein
MAEPLRTVTTVSTSVAPSSTTVRPSRLGRALAPGKWVLRTIGNAAFLAALVPALITLRVVAPILLRRAMRG